MTVTIFLPVLFAAMSVALLVRRKLNALFVIFMLTMALGGSAVIVAPMLGGASILVSHMAFLMVLLATMVTLPGDQLVGAARTHAAGLLLALYALVMGYFGPRLFGGGDVLVVPMRNNVDGMIPLQPQSSNLTHTAYMIGSLLLAWIATALFRTRLTFADLRNATLILGAVHALLGIIDFVTGFAGGDVLSFLRTASYGMLDQTLNGIPRASGAYPEPSSYATVSAALMVFCAELWLQKGDRTAGVIGVLLMVSIALSISSAGLFAAALYGLVLVFRICSSYRTPGMLARLTAFLSICLMAVGGLLFAVMMSPGGLGPYGDVFSLMTIDKFGSDSASERTGWAMQGVTLFMDSMGFGVGAGTFRSSSFLTAVLGSFGLVGVLLLGVYLVQLMTVMSRQGPENVNYRIAAWAAFGALAPQLVVGVTPDPGLLFAVFAGFALARRERAFVPSFATVRVAG